MILGIPSWLVIAGKKVRFPPSAKERSPSSTTVVNMVRSEGLLGAGRECLWKHWLVMRRSLAAGAKAADMAYFLMFAPGVTPLSGMVAAIGSRWTVEQCFEEAKGEVDLDQYGCDSFTDGIVTSPCACSLTAFSSSCEPKARQRGTGGEKTGRPF